MFTIIKESIEDMLPRKIENEPELVELVKSLILKDLNNINDETSYQKRLRWEEEVSNNINFSGLDKKITSKLVDKAIRYLKRDGDLREDIIAPSFGGISPSSFKKVDRTN